MNVHFYTKATAPKPNRHRSRQSRAIVFVISKDFTQFYKGCVMM